jgi:xanthine dehydrogenase/oxidase
MADASALSQDIAIAEVEERLRKKGISFHVNGVRHEIRAGDLDPELTVLEYLRQKGLTGTKLACGEGGCGACTIVCTRRNHHGDLVHVPVNACLATICEMNGTLLTTVEGLANKDASVLHPIPKAMSDSHGSQCGYCTPGIVMSMYGLWLKSKSPSVQDIEEHFDGNLCRCTGYRPILQAFQPFGHDHEARLEKGEALPATPVQKENCTKKKTCCGRNIPAILGEASSKFAEGLQSKLEEMAAKLEKPQPFSISGSHLGSPCEWFQPSSLRDVLVILSAKSNVRLQVGNTERRIEKFFKWNHTYPLTLVSLSQVDEMDGIQWSENEVRLGASMPLQQIYEDFQAKIENCGSSGHHVAPQMRVLQAYRAMIRWFAGHQIRSVAGLGGNIATASPISDLNPCHIAAGARLEVAKLGDGGSLERRTILMGDLEKPFFSGYRKTGLGPKEVIVALTLPLTCPDGSEFFQAFKQARRRDDDLAIVNAGMRVRFAGDNVADACFAFGGMSPFTKGCPNLAKWWQGRSWSHENFTASLQELSSELQLNDGAPGGMVEYRRLLARSFYFKFWAYVGYLRQGEKPPSPLTERDMSSVLEHTTSPTYHRPELTGLQHFDRDQVSLLKPTSAPDKHQAGDMQVSGRAKYCDDLNPQMNEVFMDFVLSTKAHARIKSIDASKAEQVEGFVDLITAADIQGENMLGPIAHDEEAIASEEVYHVGQILAAVCATSKYAARVAAKAVVVEYEDLPSVVSLEQAIEQESFFPLLFQDPGDEEAQIYTVDTATCPKGCIDSFFADCESDDKMEVVEGEIFMGGQEHFYLETNATIVEPRENGEFNIITSTQNLHETQLLCAKAMGVPMNKVSCQAKRLGGGFGGKESRPCMLSVPAAVAAQKLQRTVRFHMDRDVDQVTSGQRHSFLGRYKLAVNRETLQLLAADVQLYCNGGWSLDLSQPVVNRAMFHCTNACKISTVRVRAHICRTNIPSNTAFRGFGAPQGMFVGETMFEHAARAVGASREALLRKNLYGPNATTFFNHAIKPADLPVQGMWDQLMTQSEFEDRRKAIETFNAEHRYRKRGLAAVPTVFGISFTATHLNQAGALVHVQKDGTVLVAHGGIEMGQGLHTKIARVAANALNIPIEAVYVKETNTDTVANTVATAASSGTDLNGGAVLNACEELVERLKPFMKGSEDVQDGKDSRQENLAKAANAAFFARVNLTAQGYFRTPIKGVNWKQSGVNEFNGDPFFYYTAGVACSEVEVDCLTGDVTMLRSDICHDVGQSINAAIDIGQVEGAFTQGVGLFTIEEVVFQKDGRLASKGPGMYKIPGFGDVPLDFRVRLLENHVGPAVMGSKAVGEPPLFLGVSVYFAIKEAILAARREVAPSADTYFRLDSPATCEKIRMACLDFMNPTGERSVWHAHA